MSRTRRLREAVLVLLEEKGTANTVEVFDHLNERFRWGATMNQVGNILAKDPRFSQALRNSPEFKRRQQLLDDLGYVQPIFRAGNSGDCTIIKSVALLLVVIGLVVFVGRFAE